MNNTPTDEQSTGNSGEKVDDITTPSISPTEVNSIEPQENTPISAKDNMNTHTPKLNYRQKNFSDTLIATTGKTPTEIVQEVYDLTNRASASVQASRLLSNVNVQQYLELHGSKAVEQINEISNEVLRRARTASDRDSAPLYNIALTGKKDIADRALGKATQKVEQTTTGVTLTIDLTSSLSDTEQ